MRSLGLLNLVNQNPQAARVLKMAMALPLLPANNIVDGLDATEHQAEQANVLFGTLFRYIRR